MRPLKITKRETEISLHERPFKRSNDINRLNPEFGNRKTVLEEKIIEIMVM